MKQDWAPAEVTCPCHNDRGQRFGDAGFQQFALHRYQGRRVVIIPKNVIWQGPKSDNEDIISIALVLPTDKLPPLQTRSHPTVIEQIIVISDEVAAMIGLVHSQSPGVTDVANNELVLAQNQAH